MLQKLLTAEMTVNQTFYIFYLKNQKRWVKGSTIEEIDNNLKKLLVFEKYGIDIDKCLNNKKIEDHVLEDRIEGVKKFEINSTPTIIINNIKFDKPITFKNLKKTLEKLI